MNKNSTAVPGEIRFYRASGAEGFLSNLFLHEIEFEGRKFACAEFAYQFGKPKTPSVAEWLMAAPKPRFCALAAHALLPYDVHENWDRDKVHRMRSLLREKFGARHLWLQQQLLDTGDAVLIEDSSTDAFWGIGPSGKGKNMLGKLLMEVRDGLRGKNQT